MFAALLREMLRSSITCFRSFSTSYVHTLENGVVKVEPAKPEQVSAQLSAKGQKFAVVMVQGKGKQKFFFFFFFFFPKKSFPRSGKQHRVSPGDSIMVDKLAAEVGQKIQLDEVLLVGSQELTVIGQPLVAGVSVDATVEEHSQTEKIHVFKKKRRKGYKRRFGHRSDVTVLRIDSVDFNAAAEKQ